MPEENNGSPVKEKKEEIKNTLIQPELKEKLDLLKRAEIRTMVKDISQAREIEAQKERERISSLETEEKKPVSGPQQPIEQEEITLIPKPPRRSSSLPRIISRIAFISAFLLIIGLVGWFFLFKKPASNEKIPEENLPAEEETVVPEEKPEVIIPAALLETDATETINVKSTQEIKEKVLQTVQNDFNVEGKLVRIIIEDTEQNKILGLKEFFEAFEIVVPADLIGKLDNDFTLFVYTDKGINRLGFIAAIKDLNNFYTTVRSWESTIEKDTEKFFADVGKTGPAPISYFKTAYYKGHYFRYISFSDKDLGICWAAINNRFVFTSSGESIFRVIEKPLY